ncbi:hypothetical protein OK074_7152 [Actinobacteria bacterium OK074]|nr:hypothetical protein OK074_7152 [Actinobacteria bacterium OK074]
MAFRTRRGRVALRAAVAVLLLGGALSACGDDSGGAESNPPTPSIASPTSATASQTAPEDPVAAEKEIRRNWEKFFDPAVSAKGKQALLENGDKMTAVIASFNGDKRGGQVAAHVTKVEFKSPTEAEVTYALTLNGATALPNASGTAVLQKGAWKMSVNTLCALVSLSGNGTPAAGC